MFLVEKTISSNYFKSITKKPSHKQKHQQQLFDEKLISHLKTLTPASVTFTWMSKAVTFLLTVNTEAYNHISKPYSSFHVLYMDYSLKVLELCNLMTSALKDMTEMRMLMKLGLRLLSSSLDDDENSSRAGKMKKAKDVLVRCVDVTRARGDQEKCSRAKVLIGELIAVVDRLPVSDGTDVVRRTLHALGALTVVIGNVLVNVLYGQSDLVEFRVASEFSWADSVNAVQKQIIDQVNGKCLLTEIEDVKKLAVSVSDVVDDVIVNGDGDGRLGNGVKEFEKVVVRFSDGVDELTNGVNGLFNGVMKTRNGVLDGVRKW